MTHYALTFGNLSERLSHPLSILRVDPYETRVPRRAIEVLTRGDVLAYPTETVYGLGCRIDHEAAVRRIFELKSRPPTDPLPVLLADAAQLEEYAAEVSDAARLLIRRYWPGPLTLVVVRSARVPSVVAGGGKTVAVRVPDHPLPRGLMAGIGGPIIGTSANSHGQPAPTTAQQVVFDLGDRIALVLDGGRTRLGVESTVVDVTGPTVRVLRNGAIPATAILAVVGQGESMVGPRASP